MRTHFLFLFVAALLAAAACSSSDRTPPAATVTPVPPLTVEEAAARGPYGVGTTTLQFVDHSRPTPANREAPGAPERHIPVEVWYPAATSAAAPEERDAALDHAGGPYPLIMFAHGVSSLPRFSASYGQHLASHGYVVAAPEFPLSHLGTPGGARITAVADQPADVSFVIDELLKLNAADGGLLAGMVDADRIGMSGHSLGGLTTMLTAYGASADPRIKAIVAVAPFGCVEPVGIGASAHLPAMVIGGTRDGIVGLPSIRKAYDDASRPKYWVEVNGADHTRFGDFNISDDQIGGAISAITRGDTISEVVSTVQALGGDASRCLERATPAGDTMTGERQREILRTTATPFFDAYLRDDVRAMAFLQQVMPTISGVRMESDISN